MHELDLTEALKVSASFQRILPKLEELIFRLRESYQTWEKAFPKTTVTSKRYELSMNGGEKTSLVAIIPELTVDIEFLKQNMEHLFKDLEPKEEDVKCLLLMSEVIHQIEHVSKFAMEKLPDIFPFIEPQLYSITKYLIKEELSMAYSLLFFKATGTIIYPLREIVGFLYKEGYPLITLEKELETEKPVRVKLSSNTELEKYIAATSFSLENKQAFETAH